jgi:hypothetical protein
VPRNLGRPGHHLEWRGKGHDLGGTNFQADCFDERRKVQIHPPHWTSGPQNSQELVHEMWLDHIGDTRAGERRQSGEKVPAFLNRRKGKERRNG